MMMRKKLKKKRYESPCFDQYGYDVIVCVVTYMLSVATFVYIALIHILSLFVCADLSRNPYRGKPNAPFYLPFVAEKVAEVKGMDCEELLKTAYSNSCELFFRGTPWSI